MSAGIVRTVLKMSMLGLLALTACGSEPSETTVQVLEREGSGQSGIATLTAKSARTEVELKVDAGPAADDPQPVHIHFGACGPRLGGVAYPLTDIRGGVSTSLLNVRLSELQDGNHAVNIHKSYPDIAVYTACGDVLGP